MTPNFVKAVLDQNAGGSKLCGAAGFLNVVSSSSPNSKKDSADEVVSPVGAVISSSDELSPFEAVFTSDGEECDESLDTSSTNWKARAKFFERLLEGMMELQHVFTGVPVDWKETLMTVEALLSNPAPCDCLTGLQANYDELTAITQCLEASVDRLKADLSEAKSESNDLKAALEETKTRHNELAAQFAMTHSRAAETEEELAELKEELADAKNALLESERSNDELATSNAILRAKLWDQRRIMSENRSGSYSELEQENASLLMKLEDARNTLRKTGPFGGEERAVLIRTINKLRAEKALLDEQFETVRIENSRLAVIVHDYAVKENEAAF